MSHHEVKIIEIGKIEKLPNADTLGMTHILGWQCVVRLSDFKEGDKAIYIEPDFMVPLSHPLFTFLQNKENEGRPQERIRVRRFRGALSQGLLVEVPPELANLPVGTNVIEQLGIERYEPPLPKSTGGDFVGAPSGLYAPVFDVESFQRYMAIFVPGEEVVATEKLHGCLKADTKVTLVNGEQVAISDLKEGDLVLSYNEDTGEFEPDRVDAVISADLPKDWVRLTFDDGRVLECTEDHKILTQRGWVPAKDLDEFDEVMSGF